MYDAPFLVGTSHQQHAETETGVESSFWIETRVKSRFWPWIRGTDLLLLPIGDRRSEDGGFQLSVTFICVYCTFYSI